MEKDKEFNEKWQKNTNELISLVEKIIARKRDAWVFLGREKLPVSKILPTLVGMRFDANRRCMVHSLLPQLRKLEKMLFPLPMGESIGDRVSLRAVPDRRFKKGIRVEVRS
jgi:hypothetical protein